MSTEEEKPPLKTDECQKHRLGLEEILVYGEDKIQARFQTSLVAKIIQNELIEISDRATHSLQNLLTRARGDSIGSSAFHASCRAKLVVHALASLHGSSFDIINSLIVVTLEDKDQFFLDPVQREDLLSPTVIRVLYENGLISAEVHEILTADLDISLLKIQVGNFIVNLSKEIPSHMTATERLLTSRVNWCRIVLPRLPSNVNLAEVIRVDDLDGTLKWRDTDDHTNGGWVENQGVTRAATTRKSDLENNDKKAGGSFSVD